MMGEWKRYKNIENVKPKWYENIKIVLSMYFTSVFLFENPVYVNGVHTNRREECSSLSPHFCSLADSINISILLEHSPCSCSLCFHSGKSLAACLNWNPMLSVSPPSFSKVFWALTVGALSAGLTCWWIALSVWEYLTVSDFFLYVEFQTYWGRVSFLFFFFFK